MSWGSYVDLLIKNEMVEEVAIWGKNAGEEAQWAASSGLQNISVEEIKKLAGDKNNLRSCGPHVGGMKCMFIRDSSNDPQVLSMDLKSVKDEQGNTRSVCVGVTNKAFIILKGTTGSNGGKLANLLFSTVDHLKKSGY